MEPREYLAVIIAKLVASAIVAEVTIVEEYTLPDRRYFRARLTLSNRDFLEVAEYFVVESGHCVTRRYRYQWMDEQQGVLKKRWDDVEHFPDLPLFPYHVHIGADEHVEPGYSMSIIALITLIELEFGSSRAS